MDLRSLLADDPARVSPVPVEVGAVEEIALGPRPDRVEQAGVDTVDLASLVGGEAAATRRGFDDLAEALERERDELERQANFAQTLVGGSVGVTSGLSVGYLIWLVRGGTLMGSVLSSLPAWRFVDPLPVLGSLADDVDGDDESLESLVDTPADGANLSPSTASPAPAAPSSGPTAGGAPPAPTEPTRGPSAPSPE